MRVKGWKPNAASCGAVLVPKVVDRAETAAVVAPEPIAPQYRLVNGVPAQQRRRETSGPPTVLR